MEHLFPLDRQAEVLLPVQQRRTSEEGDRELKW